MKDSLLEDYTLSDVKVVNFLRLMRLLLVKRERKSANFIFSQSVLDEK